MANQESREVLHSLSAASLAPPSLARAALRSFPHFARFQIRHPRVSCRHSASQRSSGAALSQVEASHPSRAVSSCGQPSRAVTMRAEPGGALPSPAELSATLLSRRAAHFFNKLEAPAKCQVEGRA
eukprot:gene13387-biopygen8221